MSARISVVIPLYNKELHIARAIDSVLSQSFQDFEIVVIDDGSQDQGADVVSAYGDSRIRVYRQPNAGVSAARNRGVELAECNVIAFLDADDAYYPGFLESVLRMRSEYPGSTAYAMNYDVIEPGRKTMPGVSGVKQQHLLLVPGNFFRLATAIRGTPVFSSSVAVDKKVFQLIGGFPVGIKLGEDLDTWIRLLFAGPIAFDSRPGAYYHLDASNRAMVRNSPLERYIFFDTLDEWVRNNYCDKQIEEDINEFKNFFKLGYAHYQVKWGSRPTGRAALRNCQTRLFSAEKRRLMIMSYLPQVVCQELTRVKSWLRT